MNTSIKYLAQKLVVIHNLEKMRDCPRWKTNVDWVVQIRKHHSLTDMAFPDTTLNNWKAGGTSPTCWNKKVNSHRNVWLCQFLGIDPHCDNWLSSDVKTFIVFYTGVLSVNAPGGFV